MSLLLNLLFPPRCTACGELLDPALLKDPARALCDRCLVKWDTERVATCSHCARPISQCLCMPSRMEKAGCEALGKLTFYHPTAQYTSSGRVIFAIKRQRLSRTLRFLGRELQGVLGRMGIESTENVVLTYLPRTDRARLYHGTDQACDLARALSRESGIPMRRLLRRRLMRGHEQKTLSAEARLINVRRSIREVTRGDCRGKTVVLVDDIVTTGAGMAQCTRLLRRMGAERVLCLSISIDVEGVHYDLRREKQIDSTAAE